MLKAERDAGKKVGDHFGTNSRLWNASEKLSLHDPECFIDYYQNEVIQTVSEAWLGPQYQLTSQLNVVHPGGKCQLAHRDYHLGHMKVSNSERYPGHLHEVCGMLTLQGAIAHCDWPMESGPTMLLPHSQKYKPGYLAFHNQDFQNFFNDNYVQMPLKKGDAVFFNPALLHGAGTNKTEDI